MLIHFSISLVKLKIPLDYRQNLYANKKGPKGVLEGLEHRSRTERPVYDQATETVCLVVCMDLA